MVVGNGLGLLACAGVPPSPCTPAALAAIQADYSAKVIALCHNYTFDACPSVPSLKADRAAAEEKLQCR